MDRTGSITTLEPWIAAIFAIDTFIVRHHSLHLSSDELGNLKNFYVEYGIETAHIRTTVSLSIDRTMAEWRKTSCDAVRRSEQTWSG
jgi:hypothetical protein